ncbi:unnamed protein product, partial [Ectocarpus sp. 8 AP-2014]
VPEEIGSVRGNNERPRRGGEKFDSRWGGCGLQGPRAPVWRPARGGGRRARTTGERLVDRWCRSTTNYVVDVTVELLCTKLPKKGKWRSCPIFYCSRGLTRMLLIPTVIRR